MHTLSKKTCEVVDFANDEAANFGHDFVDTSHILAGILRQSQSATYAALTELGILLPAVRAKIALVWERGQNFSKEVSRKPTAWLTQVFDRAGIEAQNLDDPTICPVHLVLAMLRLEKYRGYGNVLVHLGSHAHQIKEKITTRWLEKKEKKTKLPILNFSI